MVNVNYVETQLIKQLSKPHHMPHYHITNKNNDIIYIYTIKPVLRGHRWDK
jgi:hypothetical protein